MMRSLYSGVAGLKTHQTKMDVIGNNIANVNTTAYKSSSITFSELMSQTTQKASGPNAATGTGGVNAKQIGLGVKSGAININITSQGSAQSTGNPFDIMITGDNFFVVQNAGTNYFTRDGSFYVDGAGNLAMTSTGYKVMGWQLNEQTGDIVKETVSPLTIMSPSNMTYPPEATSLSYVAGILDKNDPDVSGANGKTVNLNFYDNLGYSYTAKLNFKQSDDTSVYSVEFVELLDSNGDTVNIDGVPFGAEVTTQERTTTVSMDSQTYEWNPTGTQLVEKGSGKVVADLALCFDTSGNRIDSEEAQANLDAIAKAYGYEGKTSDFLNLYVTNDVGTSYSLQTMLGNIINTGVTTDLFPTNVTSFVSNGRFYSGSSVVFNPDNGDFAGINGVKTIDAINLGLSALGNNFSDISVDFKDCSMYDNSGTSTLAATSGNKDGLGCGRKLGDMIGVSVQKDGRIYASYDNGMTKLLGQIATASFANASGLEKEGDNLYSATLNSGEFDGIGVDITAGGGYMSTGQLEMSNVDLSTEFTDMITTQRGFQANSRIITVSDTLLEELTNLKR